MKKRLVLAMLTTVVLLLLIVPVAGAVWVSDIQPRSAYPAQTVRCEVRGTFVAEASTPQFELRQGATVITGTTDSIFDSTTCIVTFVIPASAPPGAYDLDTSQNVGGTVQQDSWAAVFTVVDTRPYITSITPDRFTLHSLPAQFVIAGTNFVPPSFSGGIFWPGARVIVNGVTLTPSSVTPTEIVVVPTAEAVDRIGRNYFSVQNPSGLSPSGPESEGFPVTCVLPQPQITSPFIQPPSLPAGSPTTPIDVYGGTFYASFDLAVSTVTWDGTDLPTTYVSATHLQASVPADRLAAQGTHAVRVRNGNDPDYQAESIAVAFDVTAPVTPTPAITTLEPWATVVGVTPGSLDVIGSGFVAGAVVVWTPAGGAPTDLATSFGSSTLLHATVPLALVDTGGIVNVTVRNGPPGAPTSAPVNFAVMIPAPGSVVLTALDPPSAVAGGPAFDLKVTGINFVTGPSGAVVVWNSTDLTTTRTSATELHAQVPASLIATAGTATVKVRNGLGSGATLSNAVSFAITASGGGGGGGGVFALASLEPSQVYVGYVGPGITLTVNGSGFVSGAHIWLGTQEKTNTTFVSPTKLTTVLLPAELASVGTIQVSVRNPPAVVSPSTLPLAVGNETTDPTVTIEGADSGWHNSPVTLTFVGSDPQSGVQKVQYRCPPAVGSWTTGTSYTVPTTTQGEISVSAQVFDWCDRVGSAAAVVRIDTTKPTTDALNAVSVKRGRIARLRFRVSEPAGLSPTATVVLQVRKGKRVVWSKTLSGVPMNSTEQYSFKVRVKKGPYRWYVLATDLAGNTQVKADRASFRVR